ncbi:MAG: hypothetical protein ACR2HH_06900 [Chthoniobacterales bacterium]
MRGRRIAWVALLFGLTTGLPAATLSVTNSHDNLVGSLRQAIQDALPGDTINFASTGVIDSVHTIEAATDLNGTSFVFLSTATNDNLGVFSCDPAQAVGLTKRFNHATFP